MVDNVNRSDDSFRNFVASGRNPDVDAGVNEDIWPVGGDYPFNAVDAACELVCANAADTAAGTGAQSVNVLGLSGGLLTSEVVVTNGGTVALANQYNRFFFTDIPAAGSNGSNVGTITIQQTAGPVVLGQIQPNTGNVLNSIFTVPSDWNPVKITSVIGSIGRSAAGDFLELVIQFRPGPNAGWTTIGIVDMQSDGNSAPSLIGGGVFRFFPGWDLRLRAVNAGTANNAVTGALVVKET